MSDLNIGLANIRGISAAKLTTMESFVLSEKLDIICLCETLLDPTRVFKFGCGSVDFDVFRADRLDAQGQPRRGGGVSILSSPAMEAVEVRLPIAANGTEAIAIEVPLPRGETMCIVCIYHPNGNTIMDLGLLTRLESDYDHLVVCGDLNARHPDWGVNTRSNNNGVGLKNFLDATETQLSLVPCDVATYVSDCRNYISTLDIFLVTPPEALRANCRVLGDIGSDHLAVALKIASSKSVGNLQPPREHRDFRRGEWEEYSEQLSRNLFYADCQTMLLNTAEDVDSAAVLVESCIIDAANSHIPMKISRPQAKPFLPQRILNLMKARNRILRRITRGEWNLKPERNRLRRQIEEEVSSFKARSWQRLCDSADSEPERTFRAVEKELRVTQRVIALKVDGQVLRTPEEQSEAFAESLQKSFQIQRGPHFSAAHKGEVENFVANRPGTFDRLRHVNDGDGDHVDEHVACPITIQEVKASLKSAANRSPGTDGVYNIMLKNGPNLLHMVLARIFSVCLILGYMPSRWKQAETVMIPKPQKDTTKPENFRPISLLSTMAKLLEKILACRISTALEARGVLCRYQSGFRSNHCSSDHLLRLSQSVSISFNKKESVYAVFLDVAKAFDSVWHDGLRVKLCQRRFGLPKRMIRFLSGYLRDRTYRVRCSSAVSRWYPIHAGVPQGGSLSPLLYLLYVNDIPLAEDHYTAPSQYADDLAIWSSSLNYNTACARLQVQLDRVVKWCDRWRIVMNATKSQALVFTKGARHRLAPQKLTIHGDPVAIVDRVKFLGITYDRGLTFTPHIDQLRNRCFFRLRVLSRLCGWEYGPSTSTALKLYISYVRTLIEYGSVAWCNRISVTNKVSLDRVQNRACRIALRFPWWAPCVQMRRLCPLQPLQERLQELGRQYLERARENNPLIERLVLEATLFVPHDQWTPTPVERLLT